MKIVRDVYGNRSRWEGVLAGQTVNTAYVSSVITGMNYWRQNMLVPANSLAINDLVDSIQITGYFGDVQSDNQITDISKTNPAVVTVAANLAWNSGKQVRLFVGAGMTALNNTTHTITKLSSTTFSIPYDGTGLPNFVVSPNNIVGENELYKLIDDSIALNISNPGTYTDKYQYFAEQIRDSMLTGTCAAGVNTSISVASLRSTHYPANKTKADSIGVKLKQYEGGCHFVGGAYTQAQGANFILSEFLVMTGHRPEFATVYRASYKAFFACGGILPAKFVDAGTSSRYGTWPGYRWLPTAANGNVGDTNNAVWVAVKDWNDNLQPDTWVARYGV